MPVVVCVLDVRLGEVVAGHGLYVWGATPRQARHHTEVVEWLLELELTQR
ncbi:class II aldolase/adducin family protein [Streptomyces bottropensis]